MRVGPVVSKENKQMTIDLLKHHEVRLFLNTTVHNIGQTELELIDKRFQSTRIAYDTLVVAAGMQAERELYLEADRQFKNVRRIGDCLKVRNIQGAVWDAFEVVRRI